MKKTEEIRVWKTNEGYVRFNGAIQHIVVNKITVRPNLDAENENEQKMFEIDCVIGGVAMEIVRTDLPSLYANEDDCKNEKNEVPIFNYTREGHVNFFWNAETMSIDNLFDFAFVRELTFNNEAWTAKIIDDRELFDDADKCKYAQDIPVTEADGTTHINKGLRSRLALTDEQKELVAQYEDICKKLKDAKVGMISVDSMTYAYNHAEIDFICASYTYDDLCDDSYEDCDVRDFCTTVKDVIETGGWDNGLFVSLPKKKEEE